MNNKIDCPINGKTIFMTGGCGFIGSNLCQRLIDGNKIIIYDNLRRNAVQYTSLAGHKNLEIIKGDILDKEELARALNRQPIDILVHLAAMAGVSSYYEFPIQTMKINILGTHNVLDAAKDLKKLELFLNFSTSEVYGPSIFGAREDEITAQGRAGESRWTYAVSKLSGEHLCFAFAKVFGLPITSIRPFNIYGPGQIGEGAIQIFAPQALRNEEIKVTGDGNQIRAWCYIDDMVDGILLCMQSQRAKGEVFNIGNPRGTITILRLVETIVRLGNSKSKIVFVPHPGKDISLRVPDIEKAKNLLGYKPKVDLEEGLMRSLNWYKQVGISAHKEI